MKKIINGIMLVIAISFLTACGNSNSVDKKKEQLEKLKNKQAELATQIKTLEEEIAAMGDTSSLRKEKSKYVAVSPVVKAVFNHFIDVQGRVDGDQNTVISTRAMGPVIKVYVHAGAIVKKGQLLAELDADIVKRQMDDLKVNLSFATDVFNKQKALWEKQVGSEIQYLSAKSNKESLEQKMATLMENLEMYKIKSPINGTIDEVFVKIGQNVAPGIPCFRVVNLDELKAKSDVAETYASQIREGNAVRLLFPDLDNREVNSTISFTSRVINQQNRTFTIESKLPSGKDFIPNMICIFRVLDYVSKNAIVVPVNTIQQTDGKSYIMVAQKLENKTKAVKKEVVVGKIYKDNAEILSGIQEGDLIITTGYQDINDNELISY